MKQLFIGALCCILFLSYDKVAAQGCVAIRSNGGFCTMNESDDQIDTASKWEISTNSRYFKSFRHYVGTVYQKQRAVEGNEVINHQFTQDLTVTRLFNARWSLMVDMPIEANSRSQTYTQDDLIHRFATHSFGVGDIRFAVYYWLLNPLKVPRGNIQVGLGIKLPTGNYDYCDYFKTSDSTQTYGPVDQSIELGDGGTGLTLEINTYYNFSKSWGSYGNFFYLSNPRDQNGTSNAHGAPPSESSILNGSDVMSCPDQYMGRLGINYTSEHLMFSAGVRDDCLPVHDLIGGSDGFRRPGFIISAEPGITYMIKKITFYSFVPIAVIRDRTQSVPDKITTALTGVYTHGDAAFANYVINVGAAFRF